MGKLIRNGIEYSGVGGMSDAFKAALHNILAECAYISTSGGALLSALDTAMGYTPPENQYVTDGLILHYDGLSDENTDTLIADLIGDKDITVTSGARAADGYVFTNATSTSYVSADSSFYDSVKTIEVYVDSTTAAQTGIVSLVSGAKIDSTYAYSKGVFLYSDSTVGFVGVSGSTYGEGDGITGEKTISATYGDDNACNHAYINGTELTLSSASHSNRPKTANSVALGCQLPYNNLYKFKGTIKSVRMYNRALTASEIATNHAADVARFS